MSDNELGIDKIISCLKSWVGEKITAYLAGFSKVEDLNRLDDLEPLVKDRLNCAYRAVQLIVEEYSSETARAWLFGMNSHFDDRAPAGIIRHAEGSQDLTDIFPAARAFCFL